MPYEGKIIFNTNIDKNSEYLRSIKNLQLTFTFIKIFKKKLLKKIICTRILFFRFHDKGKLTAHPKTKKDILI